MDSENAATGRQDISRGLVIGIAVAAVVLLTIGLAVGITRDSNAGSADEEQSSNGEDSSSGWAGDLLTEPREKPDLVLTDTDGETFDLQEETKGKLTLLFFGYTNCPDVCPGTLTNIAGALENMPPEVTSETEVVFVSVDPERDTRKVIRSYLDNYDTSFIGLTGSPEELRDAQATAKIPEATFDEPDDSGYYTVGHYSEMIAYSPDGDAHVVYPFGTRQSDWAGDLPRLAEGEQP